MKFYLVDCDSVKASSLINYNIEDESASFAIREAQDVYLREILGDALLDKCIELASGGTIDNPENAAYKELVDTYIFEYLSAEAQVCLLVPISLKIRNMGVSQDSDTNVVTQVLATVKELREYWLTLAIDKGNRMKCYLRENAAAFPELSDTSCVCGACKKGADLRLEAKTNLML